MSTVRFLQMCSKEQAADFLAEFNATEETIKDDVENLKEWMRKQPHLPNIDGKFNDTVLGILWGIYLYAHFGFLFVFWFSYCDFSVVEISGTIKLEMCANYTVS